MNRRRQEIRRRAAARLAAELGLSVKAMERHAHRMARAAKELGPQVAKLKLERHGMKLTQAEELAIARVHQTLTIAMADLDRCRLAIKDLPFDTLTRSVALDALETARRSVRSQRPFALCIRCKREPEAQSQCALCHGRGWIPQTAYEYETRTGAFA